MTCPRILSVLSLTVLLASSAASALEGPKVVVTYSLRNADEGAYVRNITQTPFGLGDQRMAHDVDHPETRFYRQIWSDPLTLVIEYTADPKTEQIIAGPVALTDVHLNTQFWVKTGGGHLGCETPPCNGVSTNSVIVEKLAREAVGTLRVGEDCIVTPEGGKPQVAQENWTFIEWDNSEGKNYQSLTDCSDLDGNDPERELDPAYDYSLGCRTTCLFQTARGESICELAAGETPWPRIEPLTPKDKSLPLTSVFSSPELGGAIDTDNCTPLDPLPTIPAAGSDFAMATEPLEQDDIKENEDSQAVTFASWYAVEASRQFVPEPSAAWLAGSAFVLLGLLRRRQP